MFKAIIHHSIKGRDAINFNVYAAAFVSHPGWETRCTKS